MSRQGTSIDDVDQLVEMINLNGPRQIQSNNPKKAAKKARQKARKEEERRLKQEAERAALLAQQREELEAQLERAARELQQLRLASKAMAKRNELSLQSKENKTNSKDLHGNSRKGNHKGAILKAIPVATAGSASECIPTKCSHLCSIHTPSGDQILSAPVPAEVVKRKKKKSKNKSGGTQPDPHLQSTTATLIERNMISQNFSNDPVQAPTASLKSKKSKKKQNTSKQTNKAMQSQPSLSAGVNRAATKTDICTDRAEHSCSKGLPCRVDALTSPTFNLGTSGLKNCLHGGNTHLDWNKLSSGETTTPSSKPEMVTIRRHPTINDTTVTISIKNQNGDEDILYTLLNGQVVRSKPNAVDIDTFIADEVPQDRKIPNKSSKRKRNRKKINKKELPQSVGPESIQLVPQPQGLEFGRTGEGDVVVCTPVVQPVEQLAQDNMYRPVLTEQSRRSYSFFNDLDDGTEIDLTKLKLPPGITITKVNQPIPTFSGLAEKSHSIDNVDISVASSSSVITHSAGPTSSGTMHSHDGFQARPNVIVVDSQEYSADNESDADELISNRKEVPPGKMKRLRNRTSRYSCGNDHHESRDKISTFGTGGCNYSNYAVRGGCGGWRPSEETLGHAGISCDMNHQLVAPQATSINIPSSPENSIRTLSSTSGRLQSTTSSTGAKRKQPRSGFCYQTNNCIDDDVKILEADGHHHTHDGSIISSSTTAPSLCSRQLSDNMYNNGGKSGLLRERRTTINGKGRSPSRSSASPPGSPVGVRARLSLSSSLY